MNATTDMMGKELIQYLYERKLKVIMKTMEDGVEIYVEEKKDEK